MACNITCIILHPHTHTHWLQSHMATKLPPIHQKGSTEKSSSFYVPTSNELKEQQRQADKQLVEHSDSNSQCKCRMCQAGGSTDSKLAMLSPAATALP